MLDFHELNGYINAYMAHADVSTKVKRVEKERVQHVGTQSSMGIFTVCAQILVAVPDSYVWKKEVLPIVHGFWTQCSTIYHVGYCWGYTLKRWCSLAGNFSIHWRCLYQLRYSFRNQGEATFGSLWTGKQRTGAAAERYSSTWLNSLGKGQHADMGTSEWGPEYVTCPYPMQRVLILWKASQALPSG